MKKQQKQAVGLAKKVAKLQNQQGAGGGAQLGLMAAYGVQNGPSKPKEVLSASGRRIRFREYVQDIAGSVNFSAASFPVQPGVPTLFAWLASQAISYQEYRFLRLAFVFETEKASSTSGKVMFAFLPDASDSLPASKQDMLENQLKLTAPVWDPRCILEITREKLRGLGEIRYIRPGNLAANLDIKTYDVGQLVVATQGCADTTAIGELYVEYEVELMTPIIDSAAFSNAFSAGVVGVSPSQTSVFGTTPTVSGGLAVSVTGNIVTFNRVGQYFISMRIVGTGLFTAFTPVLSSSTAAVASGGFGGISNAAANAGTVAFWCYKVYVTARGQTLVVDCSTQATTITGSTTAIGTTA